uniref:EF-hand domain-containing protein n=1 Tax=Globisporangium ultimum (strain ATCC 200006 / CBS 805.95 / DAOM BR144) TaxID=431595 RepID=K3WTB1_GLOUD
MDIMMRLKGAGFSMIANEFHARESRLGGGFVEIVLQGLPRAKNAGEKYTNVNALIELFDEIDINGDGVMEFDEFTSFCVDAGMVATRVKTPTLKHRYVRNPKHVIKTASGCVGIEKVKWSKEFKQLMAIENTAKTVKLFDSTGKFLAEVGGKSTLHVLPVTPRANDASKQHEQPSKIQTPGSPLRGLSNETDRSPSSSSTTAAVASTSSSSSGIFILDAVFLFKYQWLAMSTTDFVISFYDMNDSRKSPLGSLLPDCKSAVQHGPSFALIKALTITTTTAQLFLRFCEQAGLLFSAGNDFVLNVWKIIDAETKVLWKRLILHQDMIMDLIEIPRHDLIVSCDLHHAILLWDIHDCRARGSLVGHTHGVKQLVYSSHHDLLLSAGFEFDAYGWDLASRQVVMRLTGHRAPLVGVQIALFQTERAVTVDCMGVFKVWDISRSSSMTGGIATASSRSSHGLASQAVQLESIDPSHQLSRFEPTAFVCLHPHRRDLWTATAGTATLHLFRSTRVQQLDEIPLRAFYYYNANKFVVVAGCVCSIWDGATGICLDEFAHVGNIGGNTKRGNSGSHAAAAAGTTSSSHSSTIHNGSGSSAGNEPSIEVLACVQDTNCKKLVVVTERGELGVFNALNFVQMRKCQEVFYGQPSIATTTAASHPTCGIVGLHYCSVNKLIIATDANESAILVIDDNPNHDSARGMKEATVLRRLTRIPGGISASAYGFHVCLIATVSDHEAQQNGTQLSLWDFETLSFVAHCEFKQENDDHTLHLVEFWPEFPVLVAADTLGGVFFYAATPLIQCNTGKLLYSFVNDHAGTSSSSASQRRRQRRNGFSSSTVEESEDEDEDLTDAEPTTGEGESRKTFLTEATQIAARKMLKWRKASLEKKAERLSQPEENARRSPPACIVTCLKVVYDEGQRRYLLFTGDESGVVRIWELTKMIERLSLSKIPEIKCKYLRRGYQPKTMFSRDYFKDVATTNANAGESRKHHQPILNGAHVQGDDWRIAMLGGEDVDPHFHPSQTDLKRLSRRRFDAKKRPTLSSGVMRQNQYLQALPRSSQSSATTASVAFAAAEAFLVGQKKNSLRRPGKVSSSSSSSVATSNQRGSRLLPLSGAPTKDAGRHREHVAYNDIEIVHSWQAHADGLTSLEVSTNPNIVITCALDMRVFVWNWQGACLGKLFDAENIGRWPWRFTKDDSQRQAERDQLVRSLIRDIELTPIEKAQKRRQTLYQEHIARKSLKDLQCVNTILLDHIISKNPELDLLVAVDSSEEDRLRAANTAATTPSDARINAALEKNRLRNCQTKFGMMLKMEKNSPFANAPTIPLVDRRNQRPEELQNSKVDPEKEEFSDTPDHERNHHLRMHSLAQVGPLLCVDKFEYKHSSTLSSTPADKMQFVEIDDLEMDKKYLEHELSISFSTSLSSVSQPPETTTMGEKTNMADPRDAGAENRRHVHQLGGHETEILVLAENAALRATTKVLED